MDGLGLKRDQEPFVACSDVFFLNAHPPSPTAPTREDAEKFNIWIALLNLENAYGTEESTLRVLGDALRHTDDGKMYMAAIDVFERSGRSALLDRCVKAVTKKYGESPEVWQRVYRTRLAQRDAEGARTTLSRALQALPKQDHVAMISQAGLLEFRQGDPGTWLLLGGVGWGGDGCGLFFFI